MQDLDFILHGAHVEVAAPEGKLALSHGRLTIGDRVLEGLVPLPFEGAGPVRLDLEGIG